MPYDNYPQAATNNAKRALKHRDENGSDCGTAVGWQRANQLANRETISHDTVVRTYSFLSRAKVYDTGSYTDADGNEVCGSVMYDAWGGDAMLEWATKTVNEMEEKQLPTEMERRTYKLELRAMPEGRTVEGYAAIFNASTDLGGYDEEIAEGAFDGADDTDVVALFNHDPNFPLARTSNGTLELEVDSKGLRYRFEAPDTTFGNDLLKMIRSGIISQSSFAFTIRKDTWTYYENGKKPKRRIDQVDVLYDVSPVTYPAYKQTSVTARALQAQSTPQGVADKDFPQLLADILQLNNKKA